MIVNEAGASVYSASKLATEEFPQFDVGQRSAVSIARRLQDPLAELVKIDPQFHRSGAVPARHEPEAAERGPGRRGGGLRKQGGRGSEHCIRLAAGVHVSGISKTLAKNIVAYREENGRFADRSQLLKVPKLGPKAFEQCAGFLRIMTERIRWMPPVCIRRAMRQP